MPVLHGDLRPTNILVSRTMESKIGDLGTPRFANSDLDCGLISLEYLAPERMPSRSGSSNACTAESDLYGLGVTLLELFTSDRIRHPYHFRTRRAEQASDYLTDYLTDYPTLSRVFTLG